METVHAAPAEGELGAICRRNGEAISAVPRNWLMIFGILTYSFVTVIVNLKKRHSQLIDKCSGKVYPPTIILAFKTFVYRSRIFIRIKRMSKRQICRGSKYFFCNQNIFLFQDQGPVGGSGEALHALH